MEAFTGFDEASIRLGNMTRIAVINLYGKNQNRLISFIATALASGLSFYSRQFRPSNQTLMTDQLMTQQLSPSAQAVFDAAFPVYDDEILYVAPAKKHAGMIAAAALRAAADALVANEYWDKYPAIYYRKKLLAIADELEAQ